MNLPLSLTLEWLSVISVASECVVSDLAAVSTPGVSAVVIGMSLRRSAYVWDPLCAVNTPPLPSFSGIDIALERSISVFVTASRIFAVVLSVGL